MKIREENGLLTQSEIAEKLGVNLRTIQKYENGSPIPRSMEKLITYEFKLGDKAEQQTEISKIDVYKLIDTISGNLNAKDARTLNIIKEEFTKREVKRTKLKKSITISLKDWTS